MVLAMASRDREARPVAEGAWLPGGPCWRGLYEQARGRAEAAEARSEALKWAEVSARCEAGYWKWQFESSRRKRLAAAPPQELEAHPQPVESNPTHRHDRTVTNGQFIVRDNLRGIFGGNPTYLKTVMYLESIIYF